jgi:hypothetical protein
MSKVEQKKATITIEGIVTFTDDLSIRLSDFMRVLGRHLFMHFPTFHPIAPFLTLTTNEVTEKESRMLIDYLADLKKVTPDEIEEVRRLGIELQGWAEEQAGTGDFIKNLKILWWDSSIGFDCPCGNTEIVMSDEAQKTCDNCGRIYVFTTKLELIKDAEITTQATEGAKAPTDSGDPAAQWLETTNEGNNPTQGGNGH